MNNRILLTGGVLILVVALAGAAFIGGRLLNGEGLPGLNSGGPLVMTGPGGGQRIVVKPGDILPASELPQTPADVDGVFDHRKDNSLFIGTGNVTMSIQKDRNGNVQASASYAGPLVEVVVTTQTILYRDVTMDQFNGPPPNGQKIRQVLKPGSLDEIGAYSNLTVWGKKSGSRIIAAILVYAPPG